jgi:DNA-binding NtrC family response regulator
MSAVLSMPRLAETRPADATMSLVPGGPAEQSRAYLLVMQGGSSSIVPLPSVGALVLGRAADAELKVDDAMASRRHARFVIADGTVRVTDLGSHNGTKVNGDRIDGGRTLASGDVVTVGEVTVVLHTAHRTTARRSLLDVAQLRARLEEEVDRAVRYQRSVSVATFALGARPDRAAVSQVVGAELRLIDLHAWNHDSTLLIALPELSEEAARAAVAALREKVLEVAPRARVGLASCPSDACDVDTLLGASRAAADAAGDREVGSARAATQSLSLGDREIVLADPAMIRMYDLVRKLARSELPVLVTGETGTGKENAAFAVHHFSHRKDKPFVTLNCAALQETLVESELFGYERGAFSGATGAKPGLLETANGGTVFLDEVGELGASAQAKLLRVLEQRKITRLGDVREREIDIRIVAATNRNLKDEIAAGRFREDLFFRLSAATVILPPLRERPREIPVLSRAFLERACGRLRREVPALSPATLARLGAHAWPGNVRELRNVVDYVAATAGEATVEPWHLPEGMLGEAAPVATAVGASAPVQAAVPGPGQGFRPLAEELKSLEQQRMNEALAAAGGVQTRAAELIGMPLRTFVWKLKQYGLRSR